MLSVDFRQKKSRRAKDPAVFSHFSFASNVDYLTLSVAVESAATVESEAVVSST